jgi:hypothetical protein
MTSSCDTSKSELRRSPWLVFTLTLIVFTYFHQGGDCVERSSVLRWRTKLAMPLAAAIAFDVDIRFGAPKNSADFDSQQMTFVRCDRGTKAMILY